MRMARPCRGTSVEASLAPIDRADAEAIARKRSVIFSSSRSTRPGAKAAPQLAAVQQRC